MRGIFKKISSKLGLQPNEWALLFISIGLALLVFLTHSLSMRYSDVVDIPIKLKSDVEGYATTSSNEETVSLRITATGFNLLNINALAKHDAHIHLSSGALKPSRKNTFSVATTNEDFISALKDLIGEKARIEVIHTDSLHFRFLPEYNKKVEVKPVESISFENQYMTVTGLKVEPDSILIYGDSTRLAGIDNIYTKPIRLSKLSRAKRGNIALEKQLGIRYQTPSVKYAIDVTRYIQFSQEVEVKGVNVPDNVLFSVYPSTATVYIRSVYPPETRDFSAVGLVVDYNKYLSSKSNKCIGEIVGADIDGVISAEPSVEIFDCLSQSKQ